MGEKGFDGEFSHGGHEPFYPPPADGSDAEAAEATCASMPRCCSTEHGAVAGKWFFSPEGPEAARLRGRPSSKDEDPCEVYFSDYKDVDGRKLPHRIVRSATATAATARFTVKEYKLEVSSACGLAFAATQWKHDRASP